MPRTSPLPNSWPLLVGGLFCCAALAARPPLMVDGDADGVSDEIDECPYTPPGVRVNAVGCPLKADDADADGVADQNDDCPYTPAGAVVDAHGCAIDSDLDGIANGIDRCPHTPLGLRVDAQGCAQGEIAETAIAHTRADTPVSAADYRPDGDLAHIARPASPSKNTAGQSRTKPPRLDPKPTARHLATPTTQATSPIAPPATLALSASAASGLAEGEDVAAAFRFVPGTATLRPDEHDAFAQASAGLRQAMQENPAAIVVLEIYVRDSEPRARALRAERAAAIRQVLKARGIAAARVRTNMHWLTPSVPGSPRLELSIRH